MYIYLNGNYINNEEASISPFDHGYMYGLGCFETIRIYNGHPFLLDDHLLRLQNGITTLNICLKLSKEEIVGILTKLLRMNGLENAYVRINISAGIGEIGLQTEAYLKPTVIIYMKPLPYETVFPPKKAVLLKTRRNSPESEVRLKSHQFLNNVLAKQEIGNQSNTEGIFLTQEGYIAEGIVSNLFWVKNNKVYTPSVHTGILNGITREFLLRWFEKNNITIEEGFYKIEDLIECDEAFITNSIQEVVPITEIESYKLPTQGIVTNQIVNMYKEYKQHLWSKEELS